MTYTLPPPDSDWLAEAATVSPDALALMEDGITWSYARLHEAVGKVAGKLAQQGVQPGDRVAVHMPSSARYVIYIHAMTRLGATFVALNTRLTAVERTFQIKAAGCQGFVWASRYHTSYTPLPISGPMPQDISTLRSLMGDGPLLPPRPIDPQAVQSILFTSGTSGTPKGAQITYANLYASAQASAERLGVEPHDRWLAPLPLYHAGGMSVVWRSVLYRTAMVLENGFDINRIQSHFDTNQITLISLVPTQLYRLMQANVRFPDTLRLILLGGAAATPELLKQATERGLPVATTYGLTEAASQVATMLPEEVRRKPDSVGKPLTGTQITIVDDVGQSQPAGEIGEIVVRGPTVMPGYIGQPPLVDQTFPTGDLGYLDSEGDLWIVQRRTDLIVSGGENIYPAEVEAALRSHPAVAEACVVGLPDAEWGQQVAAAIVLKAERSVAEADLLAHIGHQLAPYKRPRLIRFVDDLPQTASGKVIRSGVRELLERT
jgi:O-succinylbenzoic acid--CoA ligase